MLKNLKRHQYNQTIKLKISSLGNASDLLAAQQVEELINQMGLEDAAKALKAGKEVASA